MHFDPTHFATTATDSFFKRKYPYYSTKKYPYKSDSKRERKFKVVSNLSLIVLFIYMFGFPVFYTAILSKIVPAVYQVFTPATATYYPPEWLMYMVTAIPLTIGTLIWLYEGTLKLFLQSDYEEYQDYYSSKLGYDNTRAGILLAKIGLICTLITLPFVLGSRVILYEDRINIKVFYDLSAHTYKYEDVEQITLYDHYENKNGLVQECDNYIVNFSDGYTFSIGAYVNAKQEIIDLADAIVARSHKPVTNLGTNYYTK